MRMFAPVLGLLIATTSSAHSAPCVSGPLDAPFPGAVNVEWQFADIPSPRFPGVWQDGLLDGFFYSLFPGEEAVVSSSRRDPVWTLELSCDINGGKCKTVTTGAPPQDAIETSEKIGRCFLGEDLLVKAAPIKVEVKVTKAEADPTPEQKLCGVATLPEGGPDITLQRLILAAGGDPGPIDGIVGPSTRKALKAVLDVETNSVKDAIRKLETKLCSSS